MDRHRKMYTNKTFFKYTHGTNNQLNVLEKSFLFEDKTCQRAVFMFVSCVASLTVMIETFECFQLHMFWVLYSSVGCLTLTKKKGKRKGCIIWLVTYAYKIIMFIRNVKLEHVLRYNLWKTRRIKVYKYTRMHT